MTGRMLKNANVKTLGIVRAEVVPDGIPQGLTVGQVARVLRLREETIKGALTSGALPSWQVTEGRGWRYVTPDALAAFASARGLALDWDAAV